MDAAMKTSIKLCEYDDILNARHIYSLLCLTSLRNKFYGICSKAFVKVLLSKCLHLFALIYDVVTAAGDTTQPDRSRARRRADSGG